MMTPRHDQHNNRTSKTANLTVIATRSRNVVTAINVQSEDAVKLITTVGQAIGAILRQDIA